MKLSRTVGPGAIGIRVSQLKEATFTKQHCRTSSYIQLSGTSGRHFHWCAPETRRRFSVGRTHIRSASPLWSHAHAPFSRFGHCGRL